MTGVLTAILLAQGLALCILLVRLSGGARRVPPVEPRPGPPFDETSVTVIVPTLNEARRLTPCLRALRGQPWPLREILVVDSGSTDGTAELVRAAAVDDPRIRLLHDPPLPAGWVGKVWALEHGLSAATTDWILGLDADVEPNPGLVAGVVRAAEAAGLDAVSFSPCFAGQSPAERWLHPSLLLTLVYRFGAPSPSPSRLMANGQCFLARRETLLRHGGYAPARASFADDVTLARHLASRGARVGFLDGSRLYRVRSYESLSEMWREWGRSIDLSDTASRWRQWFDIALLLLVQAAPLPILITAPLWATAVSDSLRLGVLGVNGGAVLLRMAMLFALARSYERRGPPFWISALADPLAVLRIVISTLRRPRKWRGRSYNFNQAPGTGANGW